MKPFRYASCTNTTHLPTKMHGHFVFRYLEGPNQGEEFKVMVDPFYLRLEEGQELLYPTVKQSDEKQEVPVDQ